MTNNIITEHGVPSPNFNLVHSQTSTLEKILGDERPQIEDPLGLLTAMANIRIVESLEAFFYSVSLSDTYFKNDDFVLLLKNARPEQSLPQDALGIRADWALPDEPVTRYNKQRLSSHQTLDPYWSHFNDFYRSRFMRAIWDFNRKGVATFIDRMIGAFITKEEAIAKMRQQIDQRPSKQKPYLLTKNSLMRAWYQLNTGRRMPKNKLKRMARQQRAEYMSQILQFPDEMFFRLLDGGAIPEYKFFVDGNNTDSLIYERGPIDRLKNYSVEPLGNGQFKISYMGSWAIISLEGDGFREVASTILASNKSLSPWLVWAKLKNTGKKYYLSSGVHPQLSYGIDERADSLLGLIAVTNISPEQRKQLPEELSYMEAAYIAKNIHSVKSFSELNAKLHVDLDPKNIGYRQKMREAQMPLLNLMYANILMHEIPLFPRVEALYSK